MGLRCSLLGHTFVEADVERDRQDRGSEVLTITREMERCRHCGAERVISENTEVTSVAGADETSGVGGSQSGGTRGRDTTGDPRGAGSDTGGFSDAPVDPPDDPAEDDAEILTDEEERQPGQWPDEDERPTAEAGDPEPAGTGSGDTRRPGGAGGTGRASGAGGAGDGGGTGGTGGGEIIDAEENGPDSAGEPGDEPPAHARDQTVETGEGSTFESSETEDDSTFEPVGSSVTVPEGHYECSGCGFRVDADSSFRDGDVCPECREAYLEYHDR